MYHTTLTTLTTHSHTLNDALPIFFDGDVNAADERFGVELTSGALGLDEAVHQRLRHRRIIALVVTAAAVAHHVDDDVLMERSEERRVGEESSDRWRW